MKLTWTGKVGKFCCPLELGRANGSSPITGFTGGTGGIGIGMLPNLRGSI